MPTSQPTTFDEALETFEALEQELELPDWTINGVYVWKLIRFSIFSEYRQHLGLMETVHPEAKRLQKSKARIIWESPKKFTLRNPFFMAGRSTKRVIIPGLRKRYYAGSFINPISYRAWQAPYDQNATVLDKTNSLNPTPLPDAPAFEVLANLAWIRRQAARVRLKEEDHKKISGISQKLFDDKKKSSVEFRLMTAYKAFVGLFSVFTAFFKKTGTSHLYVVCGYECQAPIAAARKLGIETVEFQHGSIGRGHLGYDFKDWSHTPYFPDRMLAFGTDWFKDVHFPSSCYVDPVGYPLLEDAIADAAKHVDRDPQQLLVLSQGPIADEVLEHAATFAAQRPDWRVVIRPHPSESPTQLTENMKRITTSDNWRVEKEPSLQQHTAACAAVFGVNSTALIEALLAGCRVALLDTPSSAGYFDHLAREGHAAKVRDGAELAAAIDDLPYGDARGYFSEPVQDVAAHVEGFTSISYK